MKILILKLLILLKDIEIAYRNFKIQRLKDKYCDILKHRGVNEAEKKN